MNQNLNLGISREQDPNEEGNAPQSNIEKEDMQMSVDKNIIVHNAKMFIEGTNPKTRDIFQVWNQNSSKELANSVQRESEVRQIENEANRGFLGTVAKMLHSAWSKTKQIAMCGCRFNRENEIITASNT